MEMLMIHIAVGIGAVTSGAGAVYLRRQSLLRAQLGLFALTIISGIALAAAAPSAVGRLCVSAAVLSAVCAALAVMARRRIGHFSLR